MKISGSTKILGIFGDPIAHSLSPVMQNAALQQAGIPAVYIPFHVLPAQLPAAVESLRALQIWGVNVTIPHKEAVAGMLDELDPDARLIGAVNTIVNRDGKLVGYNTDAPGFLRSACEDLPIDPQGKRVLVLGAGGAARAALVALGRAGAQWLGLANRTRSRAQALVDEFSGILLGTSFASFGFDAESLSVAATDVDLVVNTTSIGLKGEVFDDFPWGSLSPDVAIYDMVYAPGGTPLMRKARERGHRAADGLGMLAAQGEEGFFLWTGQRPPSGVMKNRLLTELAAARNT